MNLLDTLTQHLELCDAVYGLLLEENSILRQTKEAPPQLLLDKKAALLPSLKSSVEALKAAQAGSPAYKSQIEAAQKKSMKIFHLSRENEQLLLGLGAVGVTRVTRAPVPSRADLKRTYGWEPLPEGETAAERVFYEFLVDFCPKNSSKSKHSAIVLYI